MAAEVPFVGHEVAGADLAVALDAVANRSHGSFLRSEGSNPPIARGWRGRRRLCRLRASATARLERNWRGALGPPSGYRPPGDAWAIGCSPTDNRPGSAWGGDRPCRS